MESSSANAASSSSGSGATRAQQLGFDLDGLPDSAWQAVTPLTPADTGNPAPARRIEDDAPQAGVVIRPDVVQELDALLDQVTRKAPPASGKKDAAPRPPEERKAQ